MAQTAARRKSKKLFYGGSWASPVFFDPVRAANALKAPILLDKTAAKRANGYRRNDAIDGGVNVGGAFAQVQGLVTVLNSESG